MAASSDLSVRSMLAEAEHHLPAHLKSLPGVTDVEFKRHAGAPIAALTQWETEHPTCKLPNELKALLVHANGFTVSWSFQTSATTVMPLGCLNVNSLEDMAVPIPLSPADVYGAGPRAEKPFKGKPFPLDRSVVSGDVALVFTSGQAEPEVWFRDMSCSWFFLAATFADYFRILVMHLGLPRWHYAFTSVGLDPHAKQWLRLLCPDRLAIDAKMRDQPIPTRRRVTPRVKKGGSRARPIDLATIEAKAQKTLKAAAKSKRSHRVPGRPAGRSSGRPSSRTAQSSSSSADATKK